MTEPASGVWDPVLFIIARAAKNNLRVYTRVQTGWTRPNINQLVQLPAKAHANRPWAFC
jgi:hypothetical protein